MLNLVLLIFKAQVPMVSCIWPICQNKFLKKRITVSNAKELAITFTFILSIWKVLEFSSLFVPSLQIIFYLQLNRLLKNVKVFC